jgi:hypothetical protein
MNTTLAFLLTLVPIAGVVGPLIVMARSGTPLSAA